MKKEHPTESDKARLIERAIKALESADGYLLIVQNNDGVKEFRNLKATGNIALTFLRVLSAITEDSWKAIDKATGRDKL